MSKRGSERCPVCRGRMFPGDVVCLRCQDRVRQVKPELLSAYANPDLNAADAVTIAAALRAQITFCAIQELPAIGRPPKAPLP